jgi:hypothetical protein
MPGRGVRNARNRLTGVLIPDYSKTPVLCQRDKTAVLCRRVPSGRAQHAAALARIPRESKRLEESQDLLLLILGQIPESLDHMFRLALVALDGRAQCQRS